MKFQKPKRSESSVEKSIVNALSSDGLKPLKFRSIGRSAAPDRIVLVPGSFVFFLEVKRPGEHMTPLQMQYKRDLEALGFVDEEVHDVQEAWQALRKFQAIMKARGVSI